MYGRRTMTEAKRRREERTKSRHECDAYVSCPSAMTN